MARRSGQNGCIVKKGRQYHVRFYIDVPGQEKRARVSLPICPISGPGKLTKPERIRKAKEIIATSGADSEEHFQKVEAINLGTTFRQQAERWLEDSQSRKRKPVTPNTVSHWRSLLDNWLLPELGSTPLSAIDNSQGKALVAKLTDAGLSANSIRCIMNVMKSVIASALDEKGNQVYPRQWNNKYMDTPIVGDDLNTPTLTREEVDEIIHATEGREQMRYILLAATGMRIGEMIALNVEHIVDQHTTVRVRHSVWRKHIGAPKLNSVRDVDLASPVAVLLGRFLKGRTSGPLFQTRSGKRDLGGLAQGLGRKGRVRL
jgi:integrase